MRNFFLAVILYCASAQASANSGDVLVKFRADRKDKMLITLQHSVPNNSRVEDLGLGNWVRVQLPKDHVSTMSVNMLANHPDVELVQPNYKIRLYDNPSVLAAREQLMTTPFDQDCPIPIPGFCEDDGGGDDGGFPFPGLPGEGSDGGTGGTTDNPAIPGITRPGTGADPLYNKQWGMNDIGVKQAWNVSKGTDKITVGVIDTGVDYTHEDLVDNLWRNPGEMGTDANGKDKATNGIDDDGNGYVDDIIGWDFVSNDNKPYDLKGEIFSGGNPGHGTHCAGNVAARGENGKGITGVAPSAKIMVLRFISDQGGGTTADAIKAIRYAVDNGALITSNSWGSEGEDPNDRQGNQALRDAIQYAMDKGTLFIAAAGNGHNGRGYNNDTDRAPAYPASYDHENIISVAALDSQNRLGSFSNWGVKTVDIGAPGVKVYSTVVGQGYTDTVMPIMNITWDGTSMATPHVAGAAALYWSAHPEKSWTEVKQALLSSVEKIPVLNNKVSSHGKLNVENLMKP